MEMGTAIKIMILHPGLISSLFSDLDSSVLGDSAGKDTEIGYHAFL